MTLSEFQSTLKGSQPPENFSPALQAMWFDAKGNWERAHDIAQDLHNHEGSWIHAYLHRKEGDRSNAAYWYGRAGKPVCNAALDREFEDIVRALLTDRAQSMRE